MRLSREQCLHEMGLGPIWRVRAPLYLANDNTPAAIAPLPPAIGAMAPVARSRPLPIDAQPDNDQRADDQPKPLERKALQPKAVEPNDILTNDRQPVSLGPLDTSAAVNALNWPQLVQRVAECRACTLCQQRKQAVLGVGDRQADWLFIGEGPGAEEDAKGEPFVGQAGKLLDHMLAALDLNREHKVYIANAVKCRPPGNRTPEAAEIAACRPYLERQIALIQPKIIVLLGKAAMQAVLHKDQTLASMRGQRFEYCAIPVVVTYHPAYLLRNLPDKAKAWEDLIFARRLLRQGAG